jgi:hypothetical protein
MCLKKDMIHGFNEAVNRGQSDGSGLTFSDIRQLHIFYISAQLQEERETD